MIAPRDSLRPNDASRMAASGAAQDLHHELPAARGELGPPATSPPAAPGVTQDFHRGLPGASVAPPPAPRLDAVSIVDAVGWETRLLDVVGSAASLWETGVVEADTDSVPRVVAAERGPWSRTAAAGVGVGVGVKHAGLATAAVFSKLGSSLSQAF